MSSWREAIETRDVASGWMAIVRHEDGTSTGYWGVTEQAALRKAQGCDARDNDG